MPFSTVAEEVPAHVGVVRGNVRAFALHGLVRGLLAGQQFVDGCSQIHRAHGDDSSQVAGNRFRKWAADQFADGVKIFGHGGHRRHRAARFPAKVIQGIPDGEGRGGFGRGESGHLESNLRGLQHVHRIAHGEDGQTSARGRWVIETNNAVGKARHGAAG